MPDADLFPEAKYPIPLTEQIACVAREIDMRRRVYPGWIQKGRITQATADRELQAMRAVHDTLIELLGSRQ